MKVRVSRLPTEGLTVKTTLYLENLNTRMNEGKGNDILFTSAPSVELVVTKTSQGAETKGRVSTKYKQPCSRCDDGVEKSLDIEANFILQARPEPTERDDSEDEDYEDDIGIAYFEGDQIDLEDIIQQALILPLSRFWHPACDAQGNCSHCGRECEKPVDESVTKLETISLGDLLKKAGVSKN